mgnify:CR=1 FL=1
MKRIELIEILKNKIKTLSCADFNELKDDLQKDEEGNPISDSILVSETKIRPWKISENYGVGIETEYRGKNYISKIDSEKGFLFFQNFLKEQGILAELEEMGIEDGDTVRMYGHEFDYYK